MNIFKSIRNQMVANELHNKERVFTITMSAPVYPEKIITWLTINQRAFKVAGVRKYYNNGFVFEIKYKDVYTGCDFLEGAIESASYKRQKHEKATTDRYIYDNMYRQELDCPNWSNIEDETGYKSCPNNNKGYEYLLPEDSCVIQLMLQAMGYEDYRDFCVTNEGLIDINEELHNQYNEFVQKELAKEYAY